MIESTLQAALLLAAPRELPNLRLFRRNVLTVRVEGRAMRAGIRGQADLYGYFKGGHAIEVELKTADGRISADQQAWADWCKAWEIPHIVLRARESETVGDTIMRWCNELRQT